jgi:hypothetical protein
LLPYYFIYFNRICSCECTDSRISSSRHRRRHRSHTNVNISRQTKTPRSTFTSTSYQSDLASDDEDMSTINNDDTQYLSSVSNLARHLPQPDIVQSTINEEYCHHLQQMADLSNQRFTEQSIPFFGKDDHLKTKEPSQMPTTSLEKSLLINGK